MSSAADNQSSFTVDAVNHPGTSLVSVDIASTWSDAQEKLLKSIAERSNCMRWLHTQCTLYFENVNFYLTIPNIVISTVNGSITMSISSLFPTSQQMATTIVGLISLLSAMLITLNQYIKSQQMTESHHVAGLAYGKLHRSIMNELSLRRDQRENGLTFLHHIRAEIDRLESTAPSILPHIIRTFNKQFASRTIEKPEITGDLDEVEINTGTTDSERPTAPLDDTNDDDLLGAAKGSESGAQPKKGSSVASTLTSLFTAATSVLYPSAAAAAIATLQDSPVVDPKSKHLQSEEKETTKASNVIVDMGVTTEKDDMSYTIQQQQQESCSVAADSPQSSNLDSSGSTNSSSS